MTIRLALLLLVAGVACSDRPCEPVLDCENMPPCTFGCDEPCDLGDATT